MARFNAAFMSGSVDEKFQNRYNYLLDLLDTGYIVEKMIGNSMSRIEVSPSVGIKISYGTTDMLSIDPTTGDLRVSGDIYVERLRASGSDDYMGFVKYGWGDTAVNFVTGDNDLPVQNMTEYLSITGDADTFTSSMITMLDATPRLVSTETKRNFATTLRIGVNQSLSAMDEENTAYLTASGNAANPYISLTAVGATFATRSELKVEANNITFNGNKVWHSGNDGSGSTLDSDLLDGQHGSYYFSSAYLSGRSLTDANNADVDGFMVHQLLSTASNKPTGTDHSLLTLSYNSAWSTQMAGDWRTNQWYVRTQNNGTWTSWKELWNSGSLPIEEGSWSPSVINSLNLTGITITSARYYRIGKLVQCWVSGSCSITASNTRTYFSISNPFNQINTGYPQGGGGGFQQSVSPFTNVAARIADDSGSTSNTAMLAQSAWTGSSSFSMCYSYQCA